MIKCCMCGIKRPRKEFGVNKVTHDLRKTCNWCTEMFKKSMKGYFIKRNLKGLPPKEVKEYHKWCNLSSNYWFAQNPKRAKDIRKKAGRKFRKLHKEDYNNYQNNYQKMWNNTEKGKERFKRFADKCFNIGQNIIVSPAKIHNDMSLLYQKCIKLRKLENELQEHLFGGKLQKCITNKRSIRNFILKFYGIDKIYLAIRKQIAIPIEYKEYFNLSINNKRSINRFNAQLSKINFIGV